MGKLDEVPWQRIKLSALHHKSDWRLTHHTTAVVYTFCALLADGKKEGYRILLSLLEYGFDSRGQSLLYSSVQS